MACSPYTPINSRGGEIRLLVIEPAKKLHAPLICRLEPTLLSSNPKYEALSYTWGSPGDGHNITLSGTAFWVWENAEAALRRLRLPSKPRAIWIDAICINQNDNAEKQQQLFLMQDIYPKAQQVCVWLGELTDGARIGMQKLTAGFAQWKLIFRKQDPNVAEHGDIVAPTLKNLKNYATAAGIVELGNHQVEVESGEVRELLNRPWWTRVWIIQEAVLAKKLILMCGSESAPWETIGKVVKRQPDDSNDAIEMFGIQLTSHQSLLEDLYQTINQFRTKLIQNRLDVSIYELMYDFRRLGCGNPRDRIYGFLGIASKTVTENIVPNYSKSVTTAQIYTEFAQSLIGITGALEILNCKREWRGIVKPTPLVLAYSVFDQAKYHDLCAPISDGPDLKPRKGWSRLPPGWERVKDGKSCHYYDWNTRTVHAESPLQNQPPAKVYHVATRRACPRGWVRKHDNLGRVHVKFEVREALDPDFIPVNKKTSDDEMAKLPSWVANWAGESHLDPAPLLDWSQSCPRYFAAGSTVAQIQPGSDPWSITLTGIVFDRISQIAKPWHPESAIPPISRSSSVLQAWEELALSQPPMCPYGGIEGRKNALWRTYVGDFAGDGVAPQSDSRYIECWYDRVGWAKDMPTLNDMAPQGLWRNASITVNAKSDSAFNTHITSLNDNEASLNPYKIFKDAIRETIEEPKKYGEYITRIRRVCGHRRMFVTEKGYIGIAPWNAELGDLITVLKGGKTPFLLRLPPASGYQLVGESYVYGIMGGEAIAGKRDDVEWQSFRLV